MARQQKPIKTVGYIQVNGKIVDTRTLTPQQAEYVGTQIALTLLNTTYRGRAVFTADLPPVETVFPRDGAGG